MEPYHPVRPLSVTLRLHPSRPSRRIYVRAGMEKAELQDAIKFAFRGMHAIDTVTGVWVVHAAMHAARALHVCHMCATCVRCVRVVCMAIVCDGIHRVCHMCDT